MSKVSLKIPTNILCDFNQLADVFGLDDKLLTSLSHLDDTWIPELDIFSELPIFMACVNTKRIISFELDRIISFEIN